MPPKRTAAKLTVEQLLQQAAALSPEELGELKVGIDALGSIERQNQQQDVEKADPQVDEHSKPSNQQGYIEHKMINGCGPYRYLRFWVGRKHRSVYLGKAQPP